jgi:hypothetical protein
VTKMPKFKIEVTKEEARKIRTLLDWLGDKQMFPLGFPEELVGLLRQVNSINDGGCEKHGIMETTFRISESETWKVCQKCDPKLHAKFTADKGARVVR